MEGIALTSEPVSTKNMCACEYHVQKIGDLKKKKEVEEGRKHLSPRVSGLGVSPVAGLPALLSSFPKLFVVPAERGWLGVGGGGAVACCILVARVVHE